MNKCSPLPLEVRKRGVADGGGARLTYFGEKTNRGFEQLMVVHEYFKSSINEKLWLCFFNQRYLFIDNKKITKYERNNY